ncbi:MAG: FG-GAP repeat domain-containing protein, partial [Phycisphaerae bacterium]
LVGGINLFQADYDRDGFLDIFVCRGAWLRENGRHPNSLLRNNGDGTFSDVTREAGLFALHPTHSASWGDFNLDGWIDLFVANESSTGSRNPCQLYRNNMDGTFTDIAANAGVNLLAFSKAAVWGDVNNDGLLDLYVSNLMQPNVLFLNKGKQADWTFEEVSNRAGVASHNPSFPTWFWDYNNDGHLDIFVAPFPGFLSDSLSQIAGGYLGARPTGLSPALFKNNGKGQFSNVAEDIGLSDMMLAMGANFGDLDNDGFPDFYIGTGEPSLNTLVPNRMYRNDQGRSFQNVTFSGGFGHLQKGHGIAFGDIDQDGDQDVYAVMGGAYAGDIAYNALYINPGNDNAWITLKLEGTTSNRDAIGARIAIFTRNPDGKAQRFHAHVSSGGSFGASSLQQELGIGNAATIERVEIRWPGQKNPQTLTTLQCNTAYHIVQGDDKPKTLFTAAGNRNQN